MTSHALSVYWRIENFSLLGYRTAAVRSAPFSLRCGSRKRFYIEFHPAHALLLPGTVRLRASDERADGTTGGGRLPRLLRVSFYARLLDTGEYQEFHSRGRILDGQKVKDCKGWFKRFPYILERRERYLADDTLTLLVQFSSGEPVFEVSRLHARTRIPIKSSSFEWKVDLSKRSSGKSVPGLPIDLVWKTDSFEQRDAFMLLVLPRYFAIHPVVFDVFFRDDCGELAVIGELGIVAIKGEWFILPNSFCKNHLKEGLLGRGILTLCFEFRTSAGDPVSEDFGEAPFASGLRSSFNFPTFWGLFNLFRLPDRNSAAEEERESLCAINAALEDLLSTFLVGVSDKNAMSGSFSCVTREQLGAICRENDIQKIPWPASFVGGRSRSELIVTIDSIQLSDRNSAARKRQEALSVRNDIPKASSSTSDVGGSNRNDLFYTISSLRVPDRNPAARKGPVSHCAGKEFSKIPHDSEDRGGSFDSRSTYSPQTTP